MARLARITVPGLPHYVTQHAARRRKLFTRPGDYALYCDLLAERCAANLVACWAWCLLPGEVRLVLTPADADGLSRAVGEAHRRYAAFVNARSRGAGPLFRDRFASAALDDAHLLTALRSLAFAPVRAGLARTARTWRWSSVGAHLRGRDDGLVRVGPVSKRLPRFRDLLDLRAADKQALDAFEEKSLNGRPLGGPALIARIERKLGRTVRPGKPGRKPKAP